MLLSIDAIEHSDAMVLVMRGDLDMASAPQLRRRIIEAFGQHGGDLILDLRSVPFADSFGLGVIIGAVKRAAGLERRLIVVASPGPVLDIFSLTRLDRILDVRQDLGSLESIDTL